MNTNTRSHVHSLVDQLAPVQLAALETILQSMLDPLSRKLAQAPFDEEDRKSTRLNSSHSQQSRMPSSA